MTKLPADATLTEVAFAVCTALDRAGERAVLCGGSAATFYVPEVYQSRDLDFVLTFGARASTVNDALRPLGYERAPEGMYRHPSIPYTVEFPAGPLRIGLETIVTFVTERRGDLLLHVYTVTDVVRDRFMHFWAWGDQHARRIALAVAARGGPMWISHCSRRGRRKNCARCRSIAMSAGCSSWRTSDAP